MNNETNLFLDLIKNKRVALVGPSSSLLKQNYGSIIDSYDIVIRINKFHVLISKPEIYGKRTDILYHNFSIWHFPDKIKTELTKIKLIKALPLQSKNLDEKNMKINNLPNFNKCVKKMCNLQFEKYSEEIYNKFFLSNIWKGLWYGGWPTAGFFSMIELLYFLNDIKELGIFGIDFCTYHHENTYTQTWTSDNGTFGDVHNMINEFYKFKEIYQNIDINLKKKIKIYDKDFLYLLKQSPLKQYGSWVLFYSNGRPALRNRDTGRMIWKPQPFPFSIPVHEKIGL
tara:strand:+ start:527 stop:1378 length:852 start_codon:yes stop_codon:yes gene_type:complete